MKRFPGKGAALDLNGVRFGRLMPFGRPLKTATGKTTWWCECDCGRRLLVKVQSLRSGNTRSCGCLREDAPVLGDVFWSSLKTVDGCWEWQGQRNKKGYGMVSSIRDPILAAANPGKRNWLTHRVAWVLAKGPIPDGMLVCHTCDNPACCRVGHLFLGTPKKNTADMIKKGRGHWQR